MKARTPLMPGAVERLAAMDAALERAYGTPEAELGNKSDPLDEAIYIILSFQTDLPRLGLTWSKLRQAYPTWDAVERASEREIARVLREGGLHRQKARRIRRLLASVWVVAGSLSLDSLRSVSAEEAERILTRLPGLSWKAARCVLLYSLRYDVLPVDGNTFRILKRTGVLSRRAVYRRRSLHDAVQEAVPAERRRSLHINLVVHGQRTCLPRKPECFRCALFAECPRIGLPARTRRSSHRSVVIPRTGRAKIAQTYARP